MSPVYQILVLASQPGASPPTVKAATGSWGAALQRHPGYVPAGKMFNAHKRTENI